MARSGVQVGERGRELFVPSTAGMILPHGVTESLLRSSGRAVTADVGVPPTLVLQVHGDFIGDRAYVDRLAEKLAPVIPRVAMYESRV